MTEPPEETRRFVEGFALVLTRAGMQRMAARVFAALLSHDDPLTAKQIGTALDVSPAAVSGAVGYLTGIGMIERGREPGARVDHYGLGDEFWYEAMVHRSATMDELVGWLRRGVAAAPTGGAAAGRLEETLSFFEYVDAELPLMLERWRRAREGDRS